MSRFSAARAFEHGLIERTGVLLVQLGSPDRPETAPLRRYLKQFLSDPRVVEIPALPWWLILNGIILRTRPRKSAAKYATVWTDQGSPLKVHTEAQAKYLQGFLAKGGHDLVVAWAMRYGEPSIATALDSLREQNVTRLLLLPMYPQYAGSTTATAFDEVTRVLRGWRNLPELRMVRNFHDQPAYIEALANSIVHAWGNDGPPEQLVMSFHGVPHQTLLDGDPYHCECHATARLLAARLGLSKDRWRLTFQSRFGRARWLEPYTDKVLQELGAAGCGRVDLVCPGFVADCLETLEEIAIEGRHTYLQAGGQDFRYIPCLNERPDFIAALTDLVATHIQGWPAPDRSATAQQANQRRDRALAHGAER